MSLAVKEEGEKTNSFLKGYDRRRGMNMEVSFVEAGKT